MRTELYSIRSTTEEISYINDNLRSIVTTLNKNAHIKILFKTVQTVLKRENVYTNEEQSEKQEENQEETIK